MDRLIPVINKLQDVFHSVGMIDTIDLPQIAVVGSQSSGKSSVLENIVGRDFLPRGSGIVTRRPLVLQLINRGSDKKTTSGNLSQNNTEEWGEFLHIPTKKFFDFQEIKKEIEDETDRSTGKNKGISPVPIHLKIFSPYVLNLTLVDLPGITKVPVGDQPKDIEIQIRKMILQYISKPNCIILAVTSANTDIANSDALKLAGEVDRKGSRTLGVLTKLDLMDKGTDAMDVLSGKVIPLRKGFIGVINRGQNDINQKKSIREALKSEKVFFQEHEAYSKIAEKMGTPHLAKVLNHILLTHIKETLPDIKNKITTMIQRAQLRLAEYGEAVEDAEMSNGALLLQQLTKFSTTFIEAIDGSNVDVSTNNLFGGARINHIFSKKFTPFLLKMDACENLSEFDIRNAIRNAKGPRTSLFIPEASFEMLVKRQVKQLENPSLYCVDQVMDELKNIVTYSEKVLQRFPNLRERVHEFVISDILSNYSGPLKDFIKNLISIEMAYINTNHPDFFNGGQTALMLMEKLAGANQQPDSQQVQPMQPMQPNLQKGNQFQNQPQNGQFNQRNSMQTRKDSYEAMYSDREKMETDIIRSLLTSYFSIVRKNVCDSVPKSIMHFLVNKSKKSLQSELVRAMYKEELFGELLKENDEVAQKRKATQQMLRVLLKAQEALNDVKDMNF